MIGVALITIIVQSCLFSTSDQNRLTTQNKLQNWVDGARTTFVVSVLLTIFRVITICDFNLRLSIFQREIFAIMFGLCKKTKTMLPNPKPKLFCSLKVCVLLTLTFCKQMKIEDGSKLRFDLMTPL